MFDDLSQEKSEEERVLKAIEFAAYIQNTANQELSCDERAFLSEIADMVQNSQIKHLSMQIADQAFRSSSKKRVANQIHYLLTNTSSYFTGLKKWAIRFFEAFGRPFSFLLVPLIQKLIYQKMTRVIILDEKRLLESHLNRRKQAGIRLNINHLGEAILGEDEAFNRLELYLKDLKNPSIEYISVKISTLYSQINLLSWEKTLSILSERYKLLLMASKSNRFILPNGSSIPKFVNLDMEEYKDLKLTAALFKAVLSDPECMDIPAGIVLQSYLPDSCFYLKELTEFALTRISKGGAPIKIRIVKGANLAMEKVEASIKGWPLAPYDNKKDVDANFKKMIEYSLRKEHTSAVKIGVGSHNIFDISYALILAAHREVVQDITIEMLEGMGPSVQRVIQKMTKNLLLYCPVVAKGEFQNAVAYLIRRLDENTGDHNFLRAAFNLTTESTVWKYQAELFSESIIRAKNLSSEPHRTQNRKIPSLDDSSFEFQNESDTDWSLSENREWGKALMEEWGNKAQIAPIAKVGNSDIEGILERGEHAFLQWKSSTLKTRHDLLDAIAKQLRTNRGRLMGAMLKEVKKPLYESDAEVSEAIDFAEYYKRSLADFNEGDFTPKGIVLIASPWNFPCSIPAGGIIAALAAGNAVLFKPAPEAVLVGYELFQILLSAGIPKELLQFVPCLDEVATQLVQSQKIQTVILTGATQTARLLFKLRPGLDLIAETGGKNSIIVTALADRDLAIRDIIQSAFGYSGQKCSACSVAILEAEVFDDPHFKNQLKNAAMSLSVGSADDPSTKINPLIFPPAGALLESLKSENWLLKPQIDPQNPCLLSPGISWGVTPESFMYQNELFGPILCVIRANDLVHAVEIANATPYGLTAGIHSLDEREHAIWLKTIVAGNCYINRGITGAVVARQPFGGTKNSSFGPGLKAGGPNYLLQLMHVEQKADAEDYLGAFEKYFAKDYDFPPLLGQKNSLRYVPLNQVILRVLPKDSFSDICKVYIAAKTCKTPIKISIDDAYDSCLKEAPFCFTIESEAAFLAGLTNQRIRLLSHPSESLIKELSLKGLWQMPKPVVPNGRIELLNYLREVSISYDYHRYGNLGIK